MCTSEENIRNKVFNQGLTETSSWEICGLMSVLGTRSSMESTFEETLEGCMWKLFQMRSPTSLKALILASCLLLTACSVNALEGIGGVEADAFSNSASIVVRSAGLRSDKSILISASLLHRQFCVLSN